MKELSVEQKAKAYDEAKYIMKEYIESGNAGVIAENTIKKAFPELAESEDERIKRIIKSALKTYFEGNLSVNTNDTDYAECLTWLRKQGKKQEVEGNPSAQNKPWSEEDETGLTNTIIMLKEGASQHCNKKDITNAVDWLKSLRPQNTWFPSDEQLEALDSATENCAYSEYQDCLRKLLKQLKKLKGE